MEDIIQRLVEVDRECVKRVESAKLKKKDAQSNMNDKKASIYDEYIEGQKEEVEKHKNDLLAKNKDEAANQEKEYLDSMNKMESLYRENKDKWVQEIVERCLK
ncbi:MULTISPECIES: hypothetical protein [Coprobacillaceae]|uniref:hypothetical protein n=1 Tax=Coprobacillaceae TaxID=2810280 RepID=UPI000E473721|nr:MULTISPECIES: hypothetical protein [Coprobacillaceae]RHM60070.1 hypothetical protein DWZ53_07975 [Coprobacillus sp. AF33-1AC]RHS92666.1 hypothetical protein DW911_07935 [Erysipelatoclostridium sp. AM42-17]